MSTKPMRIMIFGRPGAGKSTFALKLSREFGLPLYHLDCYFYLANWQERTHSEFLALQQKIVAHDAWIIDGNNTKSLAMRYARATHVIYFDIPRYLCYWRVFKRRFFFKDYAIADRAPGCNETINWHLLTYMWGFNTRVDKQLGILKKELPHVPFYRVTCAQDVSHVFSQLKDYTQR